jgi:hypothetical protein
MARRTLILGLAVLLIASTMLVLGPAEVRGAAPSPSTHTTAVHPALTTIRLETSTGGNPLSNITTFYSGGYYGPGSNTLYFSVFDPTADNSVNFTLNDPNATRDNVGSPAFSATVNLNTSTGTYFSWQTGVSYTFPSGLAIGGGWNVSVSAPLGGTVSYPIFVSTYHLYFFGNPSFDSLVLPGEPINVGWEALTDANGAPDSHLTNVSIDGWYYADNGTYMNLYSQGIVALSPTALGNYSFKIPENATYGKVVELEVWASIRSNGVAAENISSFAFYTVGTVMINYVHLASQTSSVCPAFTTTGYSSGDTVEVCAQVGAGYAKSFTPVSNLPVAIHFWDGANVVTAPGNPPTSLRSNASGNIAFSFAADNPPFTSAYKYAFYNSVNLTVTDPGATSISSNWTYDWNQTFYVYAPAASGAVSVVLNQLEYYPGQAAIATWTLGSSNSTVTGALTAVGWYLYDSFDDFLGQGAISSTASSGTVTVPLPVSFTGPFFLEVVAVNASSSFYGTASGVVTAPKLFLNPNSGTFSPGSTVTVTVQAWGDGSLSGAVISYTVWADYNLGTHYGADTGLVGSGSVANNSQITINVPSAGAPGYYYVYASLSSSGSGTVASAQLQLVQAWGYNVLVGVNTLSSYSDGSYQPGQTLTISYQISPYGNAPLPVLYTFSVSIYSTQIFSQVSSPSSSGTFQITIPSNWPSGSVILEVQLVGTYLYGNACYGGYCFGETTITVNAHPSFLSMEIGAGSGLTVGWLILLIVIIVVALLLFLLIWRKRMPPTAMSTVTSVSTPMSPPAPAPSGSAPPEWKEPEVTDDDQPPMPSPPSGAT